MLALTDTTIFKNMLSKNFGNEIKKLMIPEDVVKPIDIDDDLRIINRRFNYSLKTKVLDDYTNKKIIAPIYPANAVLTKMIPTFMKKLDNGKVVTLTNIKNYSTKNKDTDLIKIDTRTLYGLLQSASITNFIYNNWDQVFVHNSIIAKSTEIYVRLFNKVLDRLYGVNMDRLKSDKVNFLIGKFFLLNIIGKDPGSMVDSIAFQTCFNDNSLNMVTDFETHEDYDESHFYNLKEFTLMMSKIIPGLDKLANMRTLLETWMTMYGEATIMALEYYPALLDNIFLAMVGAKVNKDYIFENVVGSDTLKLYSELSNIMK